MPVWGIVLVVIVALIFIYIIVCLIFLTMVCRKTFWVRGTDPDNPCYLREEDYPSLQREEFCCGYYGKAIRGYIYHDEDVKDYQGFVILSHGFFGTHRQYLLDIDLLTKNGYKVLAYDQYGCGISDGKNQDNFSTAVYVLENVLRAVIKDGMNGDLPIYLYGHSWGGYAVSAALKRYPQVRKAVVRSGFISPVRAGLDFLRNHYPKTCALLTPGIYIAYLILFGRRGFTRGTRGLRSNHKTQVLYIYAMDDKTVIPSDSLAVYYERHPKKNASVFITERGGHNSLLTEESQDRYHELVKRYQEISKMTDQTERERAEEDFLRHLNRPEEYEIDPEIAEKILSFLR